MYADVASASAVDELQQRMATTESELATTNEELAKKANSEDVEAKFEEERNNSNTKYTNALITADSGNKVI